MVIGFRVTSGDLGTYAMHPPRKRNTKVANTRHLQNHQPTTCRNARADTATSAHTRGIHRASATPRSLTPCIYKTINHPNIETRGRTQRSAPTWRFLLDPTLPVIQYRKTSQRAAWWDVERECRETKVLSHRSADVSVYRRLRHECEAPTAQAHSNRPAIPFIQQTYPVRADTAARPYAEIPSNFKSIKANRSTRRVVEC